MSERKCSYTNSSRYKVEVGSEGLSRSNGIPLSRDAGLERPSYRYATKNVYMNWDGLLEGMSLLGHEI